MNSIDFDLVNEIRDFVKNAHDGQKRYGDMDFVVHPYFVGTFIMLHKRDYNLTNDMVIAGYLHDVIEDTEYDYDHLLNKYGETVADLVLELTSDEVEYPPKSNPNFHKIKAKYLTDKMNVMSDDAFSIKLVDRFHNVISAKRTRKNFHQRYGFQTRSILNNLYIRNNKFHVYMIEKIWDELDS